MTAPLTEQQAENTPGPWEQVANHDLSVHGELVEDDRSTTITEWIVIANPSELEMAIIVAGINNPNNWDGELLEANARLIEASPDLLAVAKAIDAMWSEDGEADPIDARSPIVREVWTALRAAIAKALGQ